MDNIIYAANTGKPYRLDVEDFDYFNQWSWHEGDNGYLQRCPRTGGLLLHVEIMKRAGLHEEDKYVDHKDRNKQDCRKTNLRMATPSQSQANCLKPNRTSDYRGIFPAVSNTKNGVIANGRWQAKIRFEKRQICLGTFDTQEQAAKAYDKAAKSFYKEFAVLNFPEESTNG